MSPQLLHSNQPFSSTEKERNSIFSAMARLQRFRGVRQRHWGSWVSEIRHPLLKTRIWLGTFETAQDAAQAYDEAARLMCGPRARTNFSFDPKVANSLRMLSASLTAKLQRCYLASLQEQRPAMAEREEEGNLANEGESISNCSKQEMIQNYQSMDDDYIEQMIQELLYCGSMELASSSSQ